ncbi:MAG: TatD family hydrolase, partial [Candidatus Micrarchaeota archaeon]|nr:TatD family hydrolase [Candidatus Micrarchaeota archaeon]
MQSQVSSVSISRKSAIALADAHCHLDMFKDYKTVVNDAYMAGVRYMITAGGSAASSRAAIKIADGTNTFAVIGIDPAWAGRDDYFIKEIEDLIRSERKIRGIGEIGLDYRLTDFDKSVQEKAFVEQLKIAKKLDVPVVVHSRDAIEDAIKLVERSGVSKVVFHFFEGSPEQAK